MTQEIFYELVRLYNTFDYVTKAPTQLSMNSLSSKYEKQFENGYKVKVLNYMWHHVFYLVDENDIILMYMSDGVSYESKKAHWKVDQKCFHFKSCGSVISTNQIIDGKPLYINSQLKRDRVFNFSLQHPTATFENMQWVRKFNNKNAFGKKSRYQGTVCFDGFDLEKLKNTRLEKLDARITE